MIRFALPLLLLAACGPSFTPKVSRAKGPFIKVKSFDFEEGDVVTVGGVTAVCDDDFVNFGVFVPAESLGLGPHTLEVKVDRGGSVGTRALDVVVTADMLANYLSVGPCDPMARGDDLLSVDVRSPVWKTAYGKDSDACRVIDGELDVPVLANADATVTIGGEPIGLDSGRGRWTGFSTGLLASGATLAQLDGPRAANVEVISTIPAVIERPGQQTDTHDLAFTVSVGKVRSKLQKAIQHIEVGKAPDWPSTPHSGPARGLVMGSLDVKVKVGGADRAAIPGGYWPVRTLGPKGTTGNQIDMYALATPVDITRNGSCNFNVITSGSGLLKNVLYDLGYEVVVVDVNGNEVARKTFPKPTKPHCPSSISGSADKTVVLYNPPPSADVMKWLEHVRSSTGAQ